MSEDNDFLSQEEIDALMNQEASEGEEEAESPEEGEDMPTLTEQEKDVLGEISNIAMGSAATALYTILDHRVEITAPEVEVMSFESISQQYDKPCVLVDVEYVEGLEGLNLLVIQDNDAAIIADLMMGGDGTDPDEELGELHISAVGEAMNQMMGSASTAMSTVLDKKVNISPPNAQHIAVGDALEDDKFFAGAEVLVTTTFDLKIGDLIDSRFQMLSPIEFTRHLVKTLVADEDITASEEEMDPEEMAAKAQQKLSSDEDKKEEVAEEKPQKQQKAQQEVDATARQQPQPQSEQPQQPAGQRREPAAAGPRQQQQVGVERADFPEFDDSSAQPLPQNIDLIKDVPLQVTVRLGKARMTIEEILDLGEGSIIELDKLAGETVDLLVNGKLIAKGEVVVIDENFGFRVKDIISPEERLNHI